MSAAAASTDAAAVTGASPPVVERSVFDAAASGTAAAGGMNPESFLPLSGGTPEEVEKFDGFPGAGAGLLPPVYPRVLASAPEEPLQTVVQTSAREAAFPPAPPSVFFSARALPAPLPGTIGAYIGSGETPGFASFLEQLGATRATCLATFCLIGDLDLEGALDNTSLGSKGLAPLQRAALVETIRGMCSSEGFNVPSSGGQVPRESPAAPPQGAPQPEQSQPQPPQTAQTGEETVSLSDTVDQASQGHVRPLTFAELGACWAEYTKVAGCDPSEEQMPSAEQLAALRALLNAGRVPFTDFAVWGPFGSRAARIRKTEASVCRIFQVFGARSVWFK